MKQPSLRSAARPSARPQRPGLRTRTPWGAALAGAVLGIAFAVSWFAPAAWLASALLSFTDGRVVLAGPQGTVWRGSAQLVFSGGAGSRDAAALPGRVSWQLSPHWNGVSAWVDAACCTPQGLTLKVLPRWAGASMLLSDGQSHWPASLLSGLGTPWNTLQPDGDLQLSTQGFTVDIVQGRVTLAGSAHIEARHISSRLSTLRPMGSYRFSLNGGAVTALHLETLDGSLRLTGDGQWGGGRLHFSGFATAAPDREAALANLLNIIGRRDGARSIITVG